MATFQAEVQNILTSIDQGHAGQGKLEWEGRLGKWNRQTQSFESGITKQEFERVFKMLIDQKAEWAAVEPFILQIDHVLMNGTRLRRVMNGGHVVAVKKRVLGQWTYLISDEIAIRFALNEETEEEYKGGTNAVDGDVQIERKKNRCRFQLSQWSYDLSCVQTAENSIKYEVEIEYLSALSMSNSCYAIQSLHYRMKMLVALLMERHQQQHEYRLVSSFSITPRNKHSDNNRHVKEEHVWHLCR